MLGHDDDFFVPIITDSRVIYPSHLFKKILTEQTVQEVPGLWLCLRVRQYYSCPDCNGVELRRFFKVDISVLLVSMARGIIISFIFQVFSTATLGVKDESFLHASHQVRNIIVVGSSEANGKMTNQPRTGRRAEIYHQSDKKKTQNPKRSSQNPLRHSRVFTTSTSALGTIYGGSKKCQSGGCQLSEIVHESPRCRTVKLSRESVCSPPGPRGKGRLFAYKRQIVQRGSLWYWNCVIILRGG
ncbi:hypothetical protein I7I51_08912 [Histoplasma capsulatum]|uniref:Uncharacterized protein n=1 Tax=Ajellomyces capsulatus TaxID=5037 RepID=A0A8A1M5K6_AJECA|nr:hypothetical protein I7I51_08912 [Histoplasma capsulatum]